MQKYPIGGITSFLVLKAKHKQQNKQNKKEHKKQKANQLNYWGFKGQVRWPFGNQKNTKGWWKNFSNLIIWSGSCHKTKAKKQGKKGKPKNSEKKNKEGRKKRRRRRKKKKDRGREREREKDKLRRKTGRYWKISQNTHFLGETRLSCSKQNNKEKN